MAKRFEGVRRISKRAFEINYRDADGNRQFETVRCETIQEAAHIRRIRQGDIAQGRPVASKPNTVRFRDLAADLYNDYLLNEYSSAPDLEARLRLHILPYFGRQKAASITTAQLKAYRLDRMNEGATIGTINRELEAMRRAFYLAKEATPPIIVFVPTFPMVKEHNARTGYYELEQLEALCRHLPPHLVPVARCGYITGWRHEEVMTRCWRHVSSQGLMLDPGETKNKEGRTFPMVQMLKDLLESIRPRHAFPDQRIFTNNGKPIHRFDKAWATACRKAGLPMRYVPLQRHVDKSDPSKGKMPVLYKRGAKKGQPKMVARAAIYFHDFRRTAYRNLLWAGVPEKQARLAVGWLDQATADRYNVPGRSDLDVIRERFDAAYGEKREPSEDAETPSSGGNFGGNCTKDGATE